MKMKIFLTVTFSVLLIATLSMSAFAESLVVYFPFDGNVKDASGNGNHGEIVGSPNYVKGKFGKAIELNNGVYVEMEASDCFLITLFCVSTLNITTTLAQDSPQWHLPDDAIARFGKGGINEITYSPDGSLLAVGSEIGIWLYDTVTHQEVALLGGHIGTVRSISFSPDGSTLASGSQDDTVRLWDVATSNLINTLTGHTAPVNSVSFSPDGNTLASSGYREVRLWDVSTRNLINILTGHIGHVHSVSFSPDGNTLTSGGQDSTVRLWDVATGNLIKTLTGHTGTVKSVSFSPDGSTIASGSTDGTVLLWRLTPTSATITFNPDSVPDQTFEVGTPVDLMLPAAIGGTPPYTYTLSALPIGLAFDGITRQINGTPTTVGTTNATYTATDNTGASASLTFTITVEMNLDINADGQVNVIDLMWVAMFYGTRGDGLAADVNADGIVNVEDFAAVAAGVDAANPIPQWAKQALFAALEQAIEIEDVAAAPMQRDKHQRVSSLRLTYDNVAAALSDVSVLAGNDVQLEKWLPLLEELLHLLAEMQSIPETTALLANYPNPFNPETWIPYQLATPADVKLTIYDIRGRVVRDLDLGHQRAGMYQSKSRAAYWDGRNAVGEPVASGLYFYTLTAGEFSATRKLLIRK